MKKYFIFLLLLASAVPFRAHAADLSFSSDKKVFARQEDFLVEVILDTGDKKVNAVEGTISLPKDLVDLIEIREGNSAINFWVEKPSERETGKISFSGITTGGFSGPKMFLFSLVLSGKKAGSGTISFDSNQVLENDGLGTKISTKTAPFNISISNDVGASGNIAIDDINPPEDFTPFISSDLSIFEGKHFVVWSTVDKQSGIDHYELRESRWFLFGSLGSKYAASESPHLLDDQKLWSRIYIKAVDKAGNERIVKIGPESAFGWLEQGVIFAIILAICLFAGKIISKIIMRRTKRSSRH